MVYQEPLSSLSREVSDLQAPCVKILVMVTFATEFCYFFLLFLGSSIPNSYRIDSNYNIRDCRASSGT